ncbi:hypothetical protein SKAU_G00110060 [Synaphobranchus kaupii]|uniref:Uncharacterized protein n=1 Tax=Synaphobranchus kaupii TaxID=118154 RepID=A0A9Q1G116_SYNKA|nr:hypothetical protein SKAU_G00110060 [Synaphobranchus kaupii]
MQKGECSCRVPLASCGVVRHCGARHPAARSTNCPAAGGIRPENKAKSRSFGTRPPGIAHAPLQRFPSSTAAQAPGIGVELDAIILTVDSITVEHRGGLWLLNMALIRRPEDAGMGSEDCGS